VHSSMATDYSLDEAKERKIYVDDDFSLDIFGHGDVTHQHGRIDDIYHVPNLNSNLLSIAWLHTCKIVEFWPDQFFSRYLKKGESIFIGGFLDSKESLYKFCDTNQLDTELTTLVSHTNERI